MYDSIGECIAFVMLIALCNRCRLWSLRCENWWDAMLGCLLLVDNKSNNSMRISFAYWTLISYLWLSFLGFNTLHWFNTVISDFAVDLTMADGRWAIHIRLYHMYEFLRTIDPDRIHIETHHLADCHTYASFVDHT